MKLYTKGHLYFYKDNKKTELPVWLAGFLNDWILYSFLKVSFDNYDIKEEDNLWFTHCYKGNIDTYTYKPFVKDYLERNVLTNDIYPVVTQKHICFNKTKASLKTAEINKNYDVEWASNITGHLIDILKYVEENFLKTNEYSIYGYLEVINADTDRMYRRIDYLKPTKNCGYHRKKIYRL